MEYLPTFKLSREHRISIAVATVSLLLLLVFAYLSGWRMVPYPRAERAPAEHALYLWQRLWNEDVRDSLNRAPEHARHLMVLAAEDGAPAINVDWKAVAATGLPTTLVFRYPASLGGRIEDYPAMAADYVANTIFPVLDTAHAMGIRLAGVQLDYDAPTRMLQDYKQFLGNLSDRFRPGVALSITTLPTWLDDPDFIDLVAGLDYFVLQVHSFERPRSISDPLVLCDTTRIDRYLTLAEHADTPYYVAFPTHGYQVAYDADGTFIGLSAEGPDPAWPPGCQTRKVRADPEAIAVAIQQLNTRPPPHFLGPVWFRMPVATDTRNWSWPTLAAVMSGRPPTVEYHAEVRHPEPGLAELWFTSEGEDHPARPVSLEVVVNQNAVVAFDCVNGFTAAPGTENGTVILRGTAPVGKHSILIAWYRMQNEAAAKALRLYDKGGIP